MKDSKSEKDRDAMKLVEDINNFKKYLEDKKKLIELFWREK